MEKRKIGSLEVSAVGLGCMGITHASAAPTESVRSRLYRTAIP